MSINVQCESCGMRRRVNERLAGRKIRCPKCEKPLTIPELAIPAEAVAEEAIAVEAEPVQADDEVMEVQAVRVRDDVTAVATTGPTQSIAGSTGGTLVLEKNTLESDSNETLVAAPVHHAEHAPSAFVDDDEDDGVPPRQKREDGELDMTPMVDVTFLLLIFFMVTASFSLQKSIKMPRQNSDLPSTSDVEEPTEELDPIELEIDENGSFLVLTQDGENETPGKHNLINFLKAAIGANKDGMRLDIKVHENAKLQMLVDGMDAGTIAGFVEIQVAEVDGFD